jgi:hypothetical protein
MYAIRFTYLPDILFQFHKRKNRNQKNYLSLSWIFNNIIASDLKIFAAYNKATSGACWWRSLFELGRIIALAIYEILPEQEILCLRALKLFALTDDWRSNAMLFF